MINAETEIEEMVLYKFKIEMMLITSSNRSLAYVNKWKEVVHTLDCFITSRILVDMLMADVYLLWLKAELKRCDKKDI